MRRDEPASRPGFRRHHRLSSYRFLRRQNAETSEYHALLLFSIAGQCMMAASGNLIVIFIALEISSISSYVLTGYLRDDKRANEAALKYFLLGSFATAFFLYGVALIYGSTGTIDLMAVRAAATGQSGPATAPLFLGLAAALLFVGLGFKVSAAPFQIWAPDVYQGAPTPVTAFLSTGPKAAAFAVFLRIFMTAFEPGGGGWEPLVWCSALASMTIGNFAALRQSNVKRMLAYSSIAHAGYVLVVLTARSGVGASAAMFSAFLLSLIGVPLTGGFFGKFYIFKAALESHLFWLTVLGLLNSAVAAYYYLRVLVMMYFREPSPAVIEAEPLTPSLRAALLISAAATLFLGIFPNWVLDFAGQSSTLVK